MQKLACPSCRKKATVATGLLTSRFRRVRCPYCHYEWHANRHMLEGSEKIAQVHNKSLPKADDDDEKPFMPHFRKKPTKLAEIEDVPEPTKKSKKADDETMDKPPLRAIDLASMNDTDFHEYQANMERLRKFRRKMKGQDHAFPSGFDWFLIISFSLGLMIAFCLLLVLLVIFHDQIIAEWPEGKVFYDRLFAIIGRVLNFLFGQ